MARNASKVYLLVLLAVAGLALFSSLALAAIAPAGQVITSRSVAVYEMSGTLHSVFSNTVSVSVLPVYAPLVTPNGSIGSPAVTARAFSGETVTFPFRLKNSGNAADAFSLGVSYPAPSDFIPAAAVIRFDANRDSIVEAGEAAVTRVGPLSPGNDVMLILAAALPQGLSGGQVAHIDLIARSQTDTSACDQDNVVRIVARQEARVAPMLQADRVNAMPRDTIAFTVHFTNTGERAATGVAVAQYVDMNGSCLGADYVPGSASSTVPGGIEFYDAASSTWVGAAPPVDQIKGVRLLLPSLAAGAGGDFVFRLRVRDGRAEGDLSGVASSDFTGGDARQYHLESNAATVHVGRVSSIAIGPRGNPAAAAASADDRVVLSLNGASASYTLWHEVLNRGNFIDSLRVAVADSVRIPDEWQVDFVDSTGAPLVGDARFHGTIGSLPSGRTVVVGLRLRSTPEGFRRFAGRELRFDLEASSIFFPQSTDRVEDVLIKANVPIVSITQSIREPTALVGDVLSFIAEVKNLTAETPLDSVVVTENLAPGLGFAGGSIVPTVAGNVLTWRLGAIAPGQRREIVFRARVKAGQETGRLVSSALAHGVTDMGERVSAGPARASVLIVEGIFTRRGTIMGAVFADRDTNGVWDAGERGVPGVSVFIEDGTYAVTDSSGLYSIPGVVEGRHVVRIDPASLPDSLAAGVTGYFGLGAPGEALIDLAPSGERRVDFPLVRAKIPAKKETKRTALSALDSPTGAGAAGSDQPSAAARSSSPAAAVPSSAPDTALVHGAHGEAEPGMPHETFGAIIISSTHFSGGRAEIEGIPLSRVAALALWINDHPGWNIFIEGHTDSLPISSAEFPSNLELSIARARSVFQMLRMNGIAENRMDYTGLGARRPITTNATDEGRALNRRVEIRVVPPANYAGGDPGLPEILRSSEQADYAAGAARSAARFAQTARDSARSAAHGAIGPVDSARAAAAVAPSAADSNYALADSSGVCSAIIQPEEGKIFSSRGEIDVEIVSPLGSDVELYVNNVPIGKERIGIKKIDMARGIFGSIYYGVKIEEGRNDILVICREYGGKRSSCVRHVYLAGRPETIVPERASISVPADGKTSPEVVFLVSDRNGLPVRDGIFVTVAGPRDLIQKLDANPQQEGVQAATSNGRVVLTLAPSRESRQEAVRVSMDGFGAACRVNYEAPLRPWFLFGYGEGDVGYGSRSGSGSSLGSLDPRRDGAFAEGKLAFYGQGEVRPGDMLTCAVDTRPIRDDMLFRRIEPEKYYPIYGDASELKFNTASRSGTYLRLDNRRYDAMLGDFRTDLGKTEYTMYHRSFNGLSGDARFGQATVRAFLTRTDQVMYQEEIGAEGTSGFYFLKHYPLVENSEKIRIEVRDRYHSERIVRVDYKQVNRDYDINYMDGSILFKEPIPSFDESLNPVTIVVSYECRNSGEENFIYGMRASVAVRDSLEFGTTAVLEQEGVENSTLLGLDCLGQVRDGLRVESEFAHSEKYLLGVGNAFRLLLRNEAEGALRWSAYYRDVGQSFFNSSFSGGKTELGSRKIGGDLTWRLNPAFAVSTNGFRHSFQERDERKNYLDLVGHYTVGALEARLGFAGVGHSETKMGDQSATLMLTGLALKNAATQGSLQWDQILSGQDVPEYPNRIQAKLSRRLWQNITGTVMNEYQTGSLTGTRHLTQLGVESSITKSMAAYSRYQLEGAQSGERAAATMGIKNHFALSEDLTATAAVEKLATVSGPKTEDYLSLSTGALYTPKHGDWRLKGDYELRLEPQRRKHLADLAGLKRLGQCWALLAKGELWFSDERYEDNHVKGSSTLGFSMRPAGQRALTLLSLIKSEYERNSPAHPGAVDKELVSSVEADYRLSREWELEGKLAARWVANSFRDCAASAEAFMYQAQIVRTIAERWDASFKGRAVYERETGTTSYGGGFELGRLMANNLWVGAGYDFGGHEDPRTTINTFSQNGFHVGLRLKFDEKIMNYFYGSEKAGE